MRPGFFLKERRFKTVAGRGGSGQRLVGIGLQPSDQFLQVSCGQHFSSKKNKWSRDQWGDRREIIQHVVLKRIESAVQHVRADEAEVDRVAVGPRASNSAGTDATVRSTHIFE